MSAPEVKTPPWIIQDALYHLGLIAAIIEGLTVAELGADHKIEVCSIAWLGKQVEAQRDRIETATAKMERSALGLS